MLDGCANPDVGRATADIAVHGEIDIAIRRLAIVFKKRNRAHDLPRLAVTALRDIETDSCLLNCDCFAAVQTFDRRHFPVANG